MMTTFDTCQGQLGILWLFHTTYFSSLDFIHNRLYDIFAGIIDGQAFEDVSVNNIFRLNFVLSDHNI
jgi:hypothetical protein